MNKSELLPIENKVANAVTANFAPAQKLCFVLGVSGGIDSTCLLHIFAKLQLKIIVVHVNYKTRGDASEKDAKFVQKTCAALNIECRVFEADYKKVSYANFQDWARTVRYTYFEEVASRVNADGIATAHNEDDQLETILQKVFRGSGLASWAGISVWNGLLFRPLISTNRAEIEAYCEDQNIDYRTDRSNLESKYARNFLRNEWLPDLTQHFPGWRNNIHSVADQAAIFKAALQYILNDVAKNNDSLCRTAFLGLPLPLQKSLLLLFVGKKYPDESLSKSAIMELSKLESLQTGKKIQLSDQLFLVRDREFFKLQAAGLHPTQIYVLKIEDLENPIGVEKIELSLQSFDEPNFNTALYLDVEKLQWPLQLRPWRKGDWFQPFGMKGHQTVADHLTNRKIDSSKKTKAMVIEDFEERVAAVIFPPIKNGEPGTISELFKCSDATRNVLMIKPDV